MRYLIIVFILQFVLIPKVMADETIGRLFFTPEQRQHLQRIRVDKQRQAMLTVADAKEEKSALAAPPEMRAQGYVKRNDGKKSTWWVNGKPLQDEGSHAVE